MTRPRFGIIVSLVLVVNFIASCAGPGESNANAAYGNTNKTAANSRNSGNDSAEELRSLIQISFEPEEATWRTFDAGGKQHLVAVLLLTEEDHRALSSKYSGVAADVQVNVDRWFPVELVTMGETSGEMTIAGKAFSAPEFYQAPYTDGRIVFVPETNYVILDLQSA